MIRILYMAGVGFSGSTLLSILLDSHPQIASVGELTGPLQGEQQAGYACSCGSAIGECAFWSRIGLRMAARGQEFDPRDWRVRFDLGRSRWARQILSRSLRSNARDDLRDRLVLRVPSWRRRLSELSERNAALAESILEETGKSVIADASKHPIRACYLSRLPAVDLWVVHLVRDAPGLVYSCMRNQGFSVASGIRLWNRGAGQVTRLFARLPEERRLRIRYEDLCTDPRRELRRVTDFLQLAPFPEETGLGEGVHHVIGNRMRTQGMPSIRYDDRWRQGLRPRDVRRILAGTRRHRALFGYA